MKEWISDNNHLLKEWDYENNGLHPGKVGRGSDKKIWWKCEDNHRWQAPVHSRVIKKADALIVQADFLQKIIIC